MSYGVEIVPGVQHLLLEEEEEEEKKISLSKG